jgi:mono/diheme cytochrome c family protein
MMQLKRITPLYFALLLAMLAAACAPASTPTLAPTDVPASPTPLTLPTTAAPATTAPQPVATTAQTTTTGSELTGAALFQVSCASCHGADAAGNKFTKDDQTIDTPSLAWSELSQTYAADPSRGSVADQVALSIVKGQDETGADLNDMMPRWSSLSQTQIDSLVQYLQKPDATLASATLTPDGMALQGEQLYVAACAACHGADGAGKTFTKDGQNITTPSIKWADLTKTYSTDPSRGSVADQVALSIVKGQDETGADLNAMMPRWTFLSKAQVDSLVQYLQTAFK